MPVLTPAQKDQFETQGFVVVNDVLPAETLAAVKFEYGAILDGLYARWQAEGRVEDGADMDFWDKLLASYQAGCDWFQPMDISLPDAQVTHQTPCHFGPAIFTMLRNRDLLDLVESLLGPELTSVPIQHVRLKPPSELRLLDESRVHLQQTAWHQDRAVAHPSGDGTQMVTVWIAVEDATEENGCLCVIPGRPRLYPHCPRAGQTRVAEGCLDDTKALALPVRAGGVVLLHPLTPHASLDNHSDQFRWSFDIRYAVTGQPTGRNHFPDFIARSRVAPETELRDPAEWEARWHATRARLAEQPHIPFHRWSAEAPVCA